MKKQYKKPITESVKVNLYNSILDNIGVVNNSHDVTDEGLGKENNLIFDDDEDAFGDIWGTDEDPNDLWGDN
ncbi:MAG: hypothetical protein IK148_03195 [Prevotella sp.]|nr:hypothetical protein [Prevotella sp.]